MNTEQKKRLRSLLIKIGAALLIGFGYALFVKFTGIGIPCVFNLITGKLCPGCGISRMFLALLDFDIVGAAKYNLLILCLLPLGIVLFVYKSVVYIKNGTVAMSRLETVFYLAAFLLCIAFTIIRNI